MFIGFNILNQKNGYIKQLINKILESFNTPLEGLYSTYKINDNKEIKALLYKRKLEENNK